MKEYILYDCKGKEIRQGNKIKNVRFDTNKEQSSIYIYKLNEFGKGFLFLLDESGNIVENKYCHSPVDGATTLVNNDNFKWYKLDD